MVGRAIAETIESAIRGRIESTIARLSIIIHCYPRPPLRSAPRQRRSCSPRWKRNRPDIVILFALNPGQPPADHSAALGAFLSTLVRDATRIVALLFRTRAGLSSSSLGLASNVYYRSLFSASILVQYAVRRDCDVLAVLADLRATFFPRARAIFSILSVSSLYIQV